MTSLKTLPLRQSLQTPRAQQLWTREQYSLALFEEVQAAAVDAGHKPEVSVGYVPSTFCFSAFPRREPENPYASFSRDDDPFTVTINPDTVQVPGGPKIRFKVPCGTPPRLFMVWLATELCNGARDPDDNVVEFRSIRGWFEELGINWGGHRLTAVKDQLLRLANCRFNLAFRHDNDVQLSAEKVFASTIWDFEALNRYNLAMNAPDMESRLAHMRDVPWPAHKLIVSKTMMPYLREYAVPLPPDALKHVANNATAMDVLFYLCYIAPRVPLGETEVLPWKQLVKKFGGDAPQKVARFRDRFLPSFEAAIAAYPEANVKITSDGLVVRHSDPANLRQSYKVTKRPVGGTSSKKARPPVIIDQPSFLLPNERPAPCVSAP